MAVHRFGGSSIPGLPSLSTLGLTVQELVKESDGDKRVDYRPIESRNVRPVSGRQKKKFPDLPIIPHGEAIFQLLSSGPIIAVDSPTGTGKTRYLPYFLAEKFKTRIRVAIPTTVAVRDAYNFIFQFTDIDVGYAAGRVIKYSPQTQLVYGTTGHFTQKLLQICRTSKTPRDLAKGVLGDIFFVDEIHTATVEITLLIGLINFLFQNSEGPKLVFSSATLNSADVFDFFPTFPIYKVNINRYPIEVIFLSEPFDPKRDDVDEKIIPIVRKELAQPRGHGIIFRPGVFEVDTTLEALEKAFSHQDEIEFYPAYSRLTPAELDEIFQPTEKMKIVIGTNIIESSITIEGVGFIINDMLVKTAQTSSRGGNKLSLEYISQSEAKQRDGRTGRTMPGRAYHLCDQAFQESLPIFRTREIDRVPIYTVVLQLLESRLDPLSILKISSSRYDQAQKILSEYGMILLDESGYQVTEVGRFVSLIPLSIQNAYMVYLAFQEFKKDSGNPVARITFRTILAVASMIEVFEPGYFFIPRRNRNETEAEYLVRKDVHIEKYHEKFRGKTDIHTLVNIFWEMIEFIRVVKTYDRSVRGDFTNYVRNFAVDNQMNNKKLREMLTVLRNVEEAALNLLKEPRTIDLSSVFPDGGYENLGNRTAQVFAQAYQNNLFVRTINQKGQAVYNDPRSGVSYRVGSRSSFSTIVINAREGPGRIIAAETLEVQGKKGIFNLCSIIVDEQFIQ